MQTIEFERHAPAMDMFSLGVLLFVMLTGHKPMKSEQARKLSYSSLQANEYPKMQSWGWKQLSQPAQKLVLQLMERNPAQRITAAQACSLFGRAFCGGVPGVVHQQQLQSDSPVTCPCRYQRRQRSPLHLVPDNVGRKLAAKREVWRVFTYTIWKRNLRSAALSCFYLI